MASITKRPNGKWRARYRDASGKEHARHFDRKVDAQRWLDEITASMVTGQYVDPKAGRETFKAYAERWRVAQVHRPTTRTHVESMLRRHAYPTLGERSLSSILPSELQAWVSGLPLAPSTVAVVHGIVSSVFKAAVLDRRIAANPCERTRLPKANRKRVVPLPLETVEKLRAALPADQQALVVLAAGTGLRQGEILGLTLDRVDFLRREVTVDRQMVTEGFGVPHLGPTKTPASVRTVPLPQSVVEALAEHVRLHPPVEVEVDDHTGPKPKRTSVALLFSDHGQPWRRNRFGEVWRAAVKEAKAPTGTGTHDLRHFYASLLIRHGESVKTVQARLGHRSAVETLDTYSHLWPDSDDRTREAVDAVLRGPLADNPRTVGASD